MNGLGRIAASWTVAALLVLSSVGTSRPESPQPELPKEASIAGPEANRLFRLALDHWLTRGNRLQRVAQRLQVAGREICEETVSPIFGAAIVDLERLPEELQPVAKDRFGAEHRFFVTAVFAGMASQDAGLRVGDAVLELNGSPLTGAQRFYASKRLFGVPSRLEIGRGEEGLEIAIEPVLGCRYPASLRIDDSINAFATGGAIAVNSGLERLLTDDAALAQVVGHELAHNIFWRPSARRSGGWLSRASEARADYVGIYLKAIAGYPVVSGVRLRLGLASGNVDYFTARESTHPNNPARALAERRTIEEIERKKQRGEPLRLRFQ